MKPRTDIVIEGRRYHDTRGLHIGCYAGCEHCDGQDSDYVRNDDLRGAVCPPCDSVLDEMFDYSETSCDGSCEPVCVWCSREANIAAENRE